VVDTGRKINLYNLYYIFYSVSIFFFALSYASFNSWNGINPISIINKTDNVIWSFMYTQAESFILQISMMFDSLLFIIILVQFFIIYKLYISIL